MDIEAYAGEYGARILRDYPPGMTGTEEAVARTAGVMLAAATHFAASLGLISGGDDPVVAALLEAANNAMLAKVEEIYPD